MCTTLTLNPASLSVSMWLACLAMPQVSRYQARMASLCPRLTTYVTWSMWVSPASDQPPPSPLSSAASKPGRKGPR